MRRVLGVDPGGKRIGIALSDPSGTIASPLAVLMHRSHREDALQIIKLAQEHEAETILVGQSLDEDGNLKPIGRFACNLAGEIRELTELPIILWDEHGSTLKARKARIEMGVKRSKRSGHLDELAAAVILQSYLDSMNDGVDE
jgi:putative Holliday junction resolvase